MPTAPALPHIVVNALDSLFCLLPLLEQRVVVRLVEERHPRLTGWAASSAASAPLPEAEDRADDERGAPQQAGHDRTNDGPVAAVRLAPRRRELHRLVACRAQERIDARKQALIELARLELRDHAGIENRPHLAVGQCALEPIADFHADAAIAGGPEQQQPVVLALFADLPELEEPDGGFLDRQTVERADHDDCHFGAIRTFELADGGVEPGNRVRAQHPGHVGHPRAVAGARVGDAGERLSADGSDQQGDESPDGNQATGTNRQETAREGNHVADILIQQPRAPDNKRPFRVVHCLPSAIRLEE